MIKKYISITKPGIIFGNLITVLGGFFLASKSTIHVPLLLSTISGISLIIASGCVFNNVIDVDIDGIMTRTQQRVMVKGLLTPKLALIYATCLAILGGYLLWQFTNLLTEIIAFVGLFFYVIVYTLGFKRNSIYGTIIGGISGAVPPLVGYCAVTNHLDSGALVLFIMLVLWQMPHFYAITIFRFKDYQNACILTLPIAYGMRTTKIVIIIYCALFAIVATMLYFLDYAGIYYLSVSLIVGLWWLYLAVKGLWTTDEIRWARQLFGFSLIVITMLSVLMSINTT